MNHRTPMLKLHTGTALLSPSILDPPTTSDILLSILALLIFVVAHFATSFVSL
jgi:hypothetical protein